MVGSKINITINPI